MAPSESYQHVVKGGLKLKGGGGLPAAGGVKKKKKKDKKVRSTPAPLAALAHPSGNFTSRPPRPARAERRGKAPRARRGRRRRREETLGAQG
mgnify:CR=1 FL=1